MQLVCVDALLAGREKVGSLKPLVQRHVTRLQNRADLDGKLLTAFKTGAQPKARGLTPHAGEASTFGVATMRAYGAVRPHDNLKPRDGGLFIVEVRFGENAHGATL